MKTKSSRNWLTAVVVTLAACLFVTVTGWLLASPSEEINQAVAASGAKSVKQANADQFLDAVASVLVGVDQKHSAPYVAAAMQARPDLKDQIMATAEDADNDDHDSDGDDRHVSQHQRKCKVCHNGHTISIPCKQVNKYLQHHPGDTRGPCPPTPPPHH